MRTLCSLYGVIALVGVALGCTSDTYGLGDNAAAEAEDAGFDADIGEIPMDDDDLDGGDQGDDNGDNPDTGADNGGEDGGEGDNAPLCLASLGPAITIELSGLADNCSDAEFAATVSSSDEGAYTLNACPCDDPQCDGEELVLNLDLPEAQWLPPLEVGGCYQFQVFAEPDAAGGCRRNRVDIFEDQQASLWYSTGSAMEDLNHNGLGLAPVFHSACGDGCGDWMLRDVTFAVKNASATLARGPGAELGPYYAINWHSYRAPAGCNSSGPSEATAWTLLPM